MSSGPIGIRGLDHVVLRSADPEGLVSFYATVLGCPVERRNDPLGLVQLRAGASLIDIVDTAGELGRTGGAAPGGEGHNMDHFCLRLEAFDGDAIRTHLAAHGIGAGDPVSRYGAQGEGPSIYIRDPDGNTVELKGPPGPVPAPG